MSVYETYTQQDLIDLFSDWYKDVNGFRPRGEYWTRERMVDWMESESHPDVVAARRAEWEEERWLAEECERRFKEAQEEQEELYQDAKERMFYEMEQSLA